MTDDKKQQAEFKITKIGLLITVIIIGGVLVLYFTLTAAPLSVFTYLDETSLNKESINRIYKWWVILSVRLSSPDEPLNLRNIVIGIAGVITLVFAGWRTYIADQNRILDKNRRFDERFDNAAAALSKELDGALFPAHLGAISGLRTLAIDSLEHTQRCMDIICSCNQWMDGYIDEFIKKGREITYSSLLLNEDNRIAGKNNQDKTGEVTLLQEKRSQEALAAVSNILTKISTNNPQQLKELKFHNKMLCGISLRGITLDGIDFQNTYLVSALLDRTSFKQANLSGANLQGTCLDVAHLEGAHLWSVHLEGASLQRAHLEEAYLRNVHLEGASLRMAHLEGTYLSDVNLQGAQLINTRLQGSTIDKTDLSSAILWNCNLYGATLRDINSENIVFNDIADVGYIKDKEGRKKYLNDTCQYMKPKDKELFKHRMEAAWQGIESKQEPAGLDMIRKNSIVTKDSREIYDITKNNLANLNKIWQEQVNEKGVSFLYNMKGSLSALTSQKAKLQKKLLTLVNELIESNKAQKNKKK